MPTPTTLHALDPQEVWGIDEAAKVAGVSVQRINDEMDCFHLPFFEIDGRYLFVRSSLEALAA